MTSQLEFEMASTGQPGQYNVRVLYSDVGETMAIALDLDAERLNERRGELENSVLASSVSSPLLGDGGRTAGSRGWESPVRLPVHRTGGQSLPGEPGDGAFKR